MMQQGHDFVPFCHDKGQRRRCRGFDPQPRKVT